MKHFLRPRVVLALLAGLAVGWVLYLAPLERPRLALPAWHASWGLYWSPDSRRLVTTHLHTGADVPPEKRGAARLWDATTGELIAVLEQDAELLAGAVFSPDRRRVAAGNDKGNIKLWDADTGSPLGSYRMKGWEEWQSAAALVFSPKGRLLMQDPSRPKMYDAETGAEAFDFAAAVGKTTCSSYGGTSGLCVCEDDDTVRIIALDTGRHVGDFALPEPHQLANHATLSRDGQVLVARMGRRLAAHESPFSTLHGPAFVWDRPGAMPRPFPPLDGAPDFDLSPDGQWLAIHFHVPRSDWLSSLAWLLPGGRDPQNVVRVYNVATGRERGVIHGGLRAAWSPDGRTLAVSPVGGAVELWDFPLHKRWVLIVAGAAVATLGAWLLLGLRLRRPRRAAAVPAGPAP
jgi:WD40 repeat protein